MVRYGDPLDTVVSFTAYSTRAEAERACADAADPKVTLVKAEMAS